MRMLRYNRIVSALVMGGLVTTTLPAPYAAGMEAPRVPEGFSRPSRRSVPAELVRVAQAATAPVPAAAPPPGAAPTASGAEATSGRKAPRVPSGAKVNFDFADYDLNELVKRVSEMTGKNFILTEPVGGKKITIMSPTPITVDEAYQVFLSVLKTSGYAVVPLGRSLKIVPVAGIAAEAIPTFTGDAGRGEGFVTRLFKVDNIDVEQIGTALGKLISPNGSIITYAPTNTLIFTDTARNIDRLIEIIQRLDVESPIEQLVILPIRFAAAADIADKLQQVLGDDSSGGGSRAGRAPATPARPGATRRRTTPTPAPGPTSSLGQDQPRISKIISDERTNALIILATEKALDDIKALVSKLDVDVDEALKSDIHVIHLKFAKAEELAQTLANLAGTGGGGGRSTTTTSTRSTTSRTSGRSGTGTTASRPTSTPGAGGGDAVATFEGGVRITADSPTNSLVITASYNDYQTVRRVIDQLDIRRKQVFVEAVILELSQDNTRDVGISYHGGVAGTDSAGLLLARGSQSLVPTDSTILSGLAVGVFGALIDAPGALGTLLGGEAGKIPAFGVVLQALQQDSDVNILSTPSILTSNNQEAKIIVGQNVPFQTGSTISTIGSNVSISREDVALTLRVTPQVNYSNEVTLEVFQEITEVVPTTKGDPLGPTTTKRSAETVVSVPDNQTVVIGGLISAKENDAEIKVPILGDIPLIGFLFRTKSRTLSKSNLLIFLTPHIIDTSDDLQNVYRVKMAQRQEFIRRFYGKSREEQIKELNNLIRYSMNLPDVPPIYPEKEQIRPQESTIETTGPRRGFLAPIPGANPNESGPVLVPVFPESAPEAAPAPAPEEGNGQPRP